MALLEAAFEGVPPPGPGSRTLYQAEAADNHESCDRTRDHLGRWQELPRQHLRDCRWALPHLDRDALMYYTPAILMHSLMLLGRTDEPSLDLLLSLQVSLSPGATSDLRDHARARLAGFTTAQRAAIREALEVVAPDGTCLQVWRRTVAHDRSGSPCHWFDTFWPDRLRPSAEDVRAELCSAFGVDPPRASPLHGELAPHLPSTAPNLYMHLLPLVCIAIVDAPDSVWRRDAIKGTQRSLHPLWGHNDQPSVRARLQRLTGQQRQAIRAFADYAIDNEALRVMWARAADHQGSDWFEVLKVP